MGLPTTASYIIAASVGVPAILKLGVNPLAAHLFVFYFACISAITPPVCGRLYGLWLFKDGCDGNRMDCHAASIPAYIAPFIFVYHPVLLMKGSPLTSFTNLWWPA